MELPEIRSIKSIKELHKLHEKKQLEGLFEVSNEDYHSGPGVSSSVLKDFLNVPADSKKPRSDNPAFDFGNALHTKVLEPKQYGKQVAIIPETINRRTKAGKAEWEVWELTNGDKYKITKEQNLHIAAIEGNIKKHQKCKAYLESPYKELAAYAYDEQTGELLKAKCDILFTGDELIFADLKTTISPNPESLLYQVKKYKYHLSAAMYCDVFSKALGVPIDLFVWIFCGKDFPFQVETAYCGPNLLQLGHDMYRDCLLEYKTCKDLNDYPSSTNELHCLEID